MWEQVSSRSGDYRADKRPVKLIRDAGIRGRWPGAGQAGATDVRLAASGPDSQSEPLEDVHEDQKAGLRSRTLLEAGVEGEPLCRPASKAELLLGPATRQKGNRCGPPGAGVCQTANRIQGAEVDRTTGRTQREGICRTSNRTLGAGSISARTSDKGTGLVLTGNPETTKGWMGSTKQEQA
ncbi:hypothetical protein VZT92_019497 [Zoarces viviparus]